MVCNLLLAVSSCELLAVCRLLFVVCRSLFGVDSLRLDSVLFLAWCLLRAVCCVCVALFVGVSLFVGWFLLLDCFCSAYCVLFDVWWCCHSCCLLFVVRRLVWLVLVANSVWLLFAVCGVVRRLLCVAC